MPIDVTTRTIRKAQKIIRLTLQAGDTIELKKNGVTVEDFTCPQGRTAEGAIAVELILQ